MRSAPCGRGGYDIAPDIIGYDDTGELCRQIIGLGDDPDTRFRTARSPHDAANVVGIDHDFAAGLLRLEGRCGAKTKRKGIVRDRPLLTRTPSRPRPPVPAATQCVVEARSLYRRRTSGLRLLCVIAVA